MAVHYVAVHLDGVETVRVRRSDHVDSLDIEGESVATGITLAFPHRTPAKDRRRLLLELASAANALAVQVTDEQVPA